MHVSSEHQKSGHVAGGPATVGRELYSLTHSLQGSISALLMCEHMLSKELAPTRELADNPTLATTLSLLKETADQIREYGEALMGVSRAYRHLEQPEIQV